MFVYCFAVVVFGSCPRVCFETKQPWNDHRKLFRRSLNSFIHAIRVSSTVNSPQDMIIMKDTDGESAAGVWKSNGIFLHVHERFFTSKIHRGKWHGSKITNCEVISNQINLYDIYIFRLFLNKIKLSHAVFNFCDVSVNIRKRCVIDVSVNYENSMIIIGPAIKSN